MPFNLFERQPVPYLPSFEEVMLTYEYEDSMRLPSYQARPLTRYHPYRHLSPYRPEGPTLMRFLNTIYDEEGIFLDAVPPLNARATGDVLIPRQPENPAPIPGPRDELERSVNEAVQRAIVVDAAAAAAPEQGEAQPAVERELEHTVPASPSRQGKPQ